jgi:hypothetical protein
MDNPDQGCLARLCGFCRPAGKRGGAPRHRARGTPLSPGTLANDLWCADFKGEFKLGVTDHASRFLLLCEAPDASSISRAFSLVRVG